LLFPCPAQREFFKGQHLNGREAENPSLPFGREGGLLFQQQREGKGIGELFVSIMRE
jgi:hypothetical protein